MKKKRYSEELIARILREADLHGNAAAIMRRENSGQSTLYEWKQKCGGIAVSDIRRLRALEDENRRLKGIVANSCTTKPAMAEQAAG